MAEHGTITMYRYGCRCDECRRAKSIRNRSERSPAGYFEWLNAKIQAEETARKARMAEIAARRADWDALFADALKTAESAKPAIVEGRIETGFEDLV